MTDDRAGDLTARARLRDAALRLFAERGFAGTSTRAIAEDAGVSHALLRHHFGSKQGLEQAVDAYVLDRVADLLDQAARKVRADRMLTSMGEVTAQVFGADPVIRGYLRRRLLDGGPAGSALFARLLEGTRRQLEQLGRPSAGTRRSPDWAPYQVLFLILGPMLLENVLRDSLGADPFDAKRLRQRSKANQRLIADGILKVP